MVASMPCYRPTNVDQQRGHGVFDRSIKGLQALNAVGYGQTGSDLQLDLVYNPNGIFLAPAQSKLEVSCEGHAPIGCLPMLLWPCQQQCNFIHILSFTVLHFHFQAFPHAMTWSNFQLALLCSFITTRWHSKPTAFCRHLSCIAYYV